MADPVPNTGDILQVTFESTLYNQKLLNTFHYRIESTGGRTSIFTIHNDLFQLMIRTNDMKDKFLACVPSDMTLNNIWVQRIGTNRVRKSVFSVEEGGGDGKPSGTANVAASIERRGDFATKHNVGRLQVCIPGNTDFQTNGHLGLAGEAALQALADLLPAAETGLPGTAIFAPVLVSKVGLGLAFNYITTSDVKFTVRVMRRRTVGVGK